MKALIKITKFQITNKITDKVIALSFGFILWTIFAANNTKNIYIDTPLCFYNTNDNIICKGPDTIRVCLVAKNNILKKLDLNNLSVHIDAQKLPMGSSNFSLTEQDLFLPASIKLAEYTPSNIIINVEQKVCQTSSEQTV